MTDRWSIAWTFGSTSIVNFLDAACSRVLRHFCLSSTKNTKQLRPTSKFRYQYRPTTRPARSLTGDNAGFGQAEERVSAVTTDIAAGAAKTRARLLAASPPPEMSHCNCARTVLRQMPRNVASQLGRSAGPCGARIPPLFCSPLDHSPRISRCVYTASSFTQPGS